MERLKCWGVFFFIILEAHDKYPNYEHVYACEDVKHLKNLISSQFILENRVEDCMVNFIGYSVLQINGYSAALLVFTTL